VPTFEDVFEIEAKSLTLLRKIFFGANFQASSGESNAGILSIMYPAKPWIWALCAQSQEFGEKRQRGDCTMALNGP
jgi:hypothetical protein